MINPLESKLEDFLKRNLKKQKQYVHYDNQHVDFNIYYDDNNYHNDTDNHIANVILNMDEKDESKLNNEEQFVLKFTQVFENHAPLYVNPATKLYHANMLFNSIIDKELNFVDSNENAIRTIYPDMRTSFYKFCQKYST
jgi:hypothetical protein